jgi:hypothetical protein
MQELVFERVNKHRALAELVIYNHKWLPWWLTTAVVGDFCEQAERFLRGEGLPPLPIRLWWAYKHWCFKRNAVAVDARKKGIWQQSKEMLREHHADNPMAQSKANGQFFKPKRMIPLAPGQRVEFIPVLQQGHQVDVMDTHSGKRRSIMLSGDQVKAIADDWHRCGSVSLLDDGVALLHLDDGDFQIDVTQVRSAVRQCVNGVVDFNSLPVARSTPAPNSLGDYPRPNCPKCHTPDPQLGTPLDPKSPSGWGDSYFTCRNMKCQHRWKWKKVFPGLQENNNKEGTKTGAVLKGTDVPFYIGQIGLTVEQLNEAVRTFAKVACIERLTPEQRLQIVKIQQQQATCQKARPLLAIVTNEPKDAA